METDEEFFESMEQWRYDCGWPWERWLINYVRWREGRPLLRATPLVRRKPTA